ncbi:MAG TPA: hypothetical protein VI483_03255 [Candidatus Paceibacterota bacterium]
MMYKIVTRIVVLLLVVLAGVYFLAPNYLHLQGPVYDSFYSGEQLEKRIDGREIAKVPQTIERLALSGPTDRGIGVRVQASCELADVCTRDYRFEYRDYRGDYYSVTVKKFKNATALNNGQAQITDFSTGTEAGFYRFEKHELGWFSTAENSFVIVQKGVCTMVNNQPETCSYPEKLMTDDVVVYTFTGLYPQT